jgi:hypothetical protein
VFITPLPPPPLLPELVSRDCVAPEVWLLPFEAPWLAVLRFAVERLRCFAPIRRCGSTRCCGWSRCFGGWIRCFDGWIGCPIHCWMRWCSGCGLGRA